MTFEEFIKKYNGQALDYDGGYGVQCVDLIKLYADKVLGLKFGALGNAHEYYDNFENISILKHNFEKIPNTPKFVPQKGDIIVWNKNRGAGAGHIAICNGVGTTSYFCSYDQNWNGVKAMQLVKHTYSNVYGVLRPKKQANNKYNAGDVVETKFQVRVIEDADNEHYKVESNGYNFELHKTMVKNINKDKIGNVIERGTIFAVINEDTYGIEVYDRQFNIKEYYINKKLQ